MIENKKHNLQPITRVLHIREDSDSDILGMSNSDTEWISKANRKKIREEIETKLYDLLYQYFGDDAEEIKVTMTKKLKKQIREKAKINRPHFGLL